MAVVTAWSESNLVTTPGATLTIQEAMAALDVSDKTIRRLLKRGDLERAGDIHGRILISAASIERVRGQVERPQSTPETPHQTQPSVGYAMVPAQHYESLQNAHTILAETVRDQAAYIRELQEQLREAQRQPITPPVQASPDTSLDTPKAPQGSAMRRFLRRLLG